MIPLHRDVDALVWHPHLLDRSEQTAAVLRDGGDTTTTARDCLSWLLVVLDEWNRS